MTPRQREAGAAPLQSRSGWFRVVPGGVMLSVRVTPNAGADRIDGAERRADGSEALRVRVSAVPDKGKANESLTALVAKRVGVPKSAVTIASGETGRLKTLLIRGDASLVTEGLAALARDAKPPEIRAPSPESG